jgi:hypothetical protein
VDSALIVQSIGSTVFSEIYPAKKFRYNKYYDFAYDQYIDETRIGAPTGGVRLRLVTVAGDAYGLGDFKLLADSMANSEAIVVLSAESPYFEGLEQAAKIRKYIKQKNVTQLPESMQDIIRKRQSQARALEDSAKALIEKAIVGGTFYVHGEKAEIRDSDARAKLDEALKQLIESVYSKLSLVNVLRDSDAEILQILNSEPEQVGYAGSGANNEYALNEISQWLELQTGNRVPISMGDVQRRYQAMPYGWREIDIAALAARLIVGQKIQIKYGGAAVGKDDRKLVDCLRRKSEIDKASVTRRIAPSEDLMRKSVVFLRDWLGQMGVPDDEDGLIGFVAATLEGKEAHYGALAEQYSADRYPEKEAVAKARDLMSDILSQRKDNVALLNRLIARQDDLRDCTENMEAVETFFSQKSQQKAIFDDARRLERSLRDERGYFIAEAGATGKIREETAAPEPHARTRDLAELMQEVSAIVSMPRPYARIKELPELMREAKATYDALLGQKKDEVNGIITQCMGDVHTLAGVGMVTEALRKADGRFDEYKQKVAATTSLTVLDAMITQLLNYKDIVCKQIETLLQPSPEPDKGGGTGGGMGGGEAPKPKKIAQMRRYEVFPVKRIQSREDVDSYLEGIRKKLYDTLDNSDGIQIN